MRGWVWLNRVKRWVGCGDMQDGLLQHYQREVELSDWNIERKVQEAMNGDRHPDLFDDFSEIGMQPPDSKGGDPPEN